MRRKTRKWDDDHAEDPGAGLLNLFDVWIAFAAALLLASLGFGQVARPASAAAARNQPAALETVSKDQRQLAHYRVSQQQAGGNGERLGIAYRLNNGEVIYVPEGTQN